MEELHASIQYRTVSAGKSHFCASWRKSAAVTKQFYVAELSVVAQSDRGSQGERYHVCQPPTGHRNTDNVPALETKNLSVSSEKRKTEVIIKILGSQTAKLM